MYGISKLFGSGLVMFIEIQERYPIIQWLYTDYIVHK